MTTRRFSKWLGGLTLWGRISGRAVVDTRNGVESHSEAQSFKESCMSLRTEMPDTPFMSVGHFPTCQAICALLGAAQTASVGQVDVAQRGSLGAGTPWPADTANGSSSPTGTNEAVAKT